MGRSTKIFDLQRTESDMAIVNIYDFTHLFHESVREKEREMDREKEFICSAFLEAIDVNGEYPSKNTSCLASTMLRIFGLAIRLQHSQQALGLSSSK